MLKIVDRPVRIALLAFAVAGLALVTGCGGTSVAEVQGRLGYAKRADSVEVTPVPVAVPEPAKGLTIHGRVTFTVRTGGRRHHLVHLIDVLQLPHVAVKLTNYRNSDDGYMCVSLYGERTEIDQMRRQLWAAINMADVTTLRFEIDDTLEDQTDTAFLPRITGITGNIIDKDGQKLWRDP